MDSLRAIESDKWTFLPSPCRTPITAKTGCHGGASGSGCTTGVPMTTEGAFIREWGGAGTGPGQFDYATGVSVDAGGDVYVVDHNNHRVQKFTGTGTYLTEWGDRGRQPGQFESPHGVLAHGADIFVLDTYNCRVQKFAYLPVAMKPASWAGIKARYR